MPTLTEAFAAQRVQDAEQRAKDDTLQATYDRLAEQVTIAGMTYEEAIAASRERFAKESKPYVHPTDVHEHLAAVEKRELERQEAPKQKGLFE